MACTGEKKTVKNISNTIAVVSYTRYSDGFAVSNQQINPGATANLYYQKGTYNTANPNQLQIFSISDLPDGCNTPTVIVPINTLVLENSNVQPLEYDLTTPGTCTGKKHTIQNVSTAIAVVSYNKFGDGFFVDEQQILPGATVNLYYITGTLNTAYRNQLTTIAIENLEFGCDSATPTPTPSATSTPVITPSQTPTPTSSITPTQTPTPTSSVTPTQTPTTTPTPTPSGFIGAKALIFIESSDDAVDPSGDPNTDILAYMVSNGATNWFGFQTSGVPSFPTNLSDFILWMDWNGFTNGTPNNTNGTLESIIPQSTGGFDSFGNFVEEYNFVTTLVPSNTVTGQAWYIVLAPISLTDNRTYSTINISYNDTPQSLISYNTESSIINTNVVYTGSNWFNTTYRVYTSSQNNGFTNGVQGQIDITNNFLKGGTLN